MYYTSLEELLNLGFGVFVGCTSLEVLLPI